MEKFIASMLLVAISSIMGYYSPPVSCKDTGGGGRVVKILEEGDAHPFGHIYSVFSLCF